jgi:hypothetical protein
LSWPAATCGACSDGPKLPQARRPPGAGPDRGPFDRQPAMPHFDIAPRWEGAA